MGWIYLGLVIAGFVAMNFIMKLGSLKGHSSPALTGALFAAAAMLCLAVLVVTGKPLLVSVPVVLLAAGGGIGGAVAYFFFLSALAIGHYALTISIYTMSFLIPVAFSIAVWKRPLGLLTAAGIVLVLAGVTLVSAAAPAGAGREKRVWSKWIVLLGAAFVLTAVPQIAQAAAARLSEINLWFFLFLTFLSGAVVFGLFFLVKGPRPGRGVLLYGILAAAGSVAGNLFTLRSLGKLPETVVFPVSLAGPVIGAVLLSLLFFKERIKPLGYLGIAFGLAGIVLLAVR
jgi:drug/metabolite transporter (DMT)-like permease